MLKKIKNTHKILLEIVILILIILILSFFLIQKNKELTFSKKINDSNTKLLDKIIKINKSDDWDLKVKNLNLIAEKKQILPEKYGAEIIQIGGPGSHYISKRVYQLNEHGYLMGEDWIDHSFNSIYDLLHVSCRTEYKMVKCYTDGKEIILHENECSMGIKYQIQNKINIVCEKITENE
ncbi:hypothetical protein K8R66_03310 [bacterium]|nr:hypothetical protein [bacterium]